MKRYDYINGVDGNYVMPVDVHPTPNFPDILYLDREGIGIRLGNMFSIENIPCSVRSFYRISPKGYTEPENTFFLNSTKLTAGRFYKTYTLIGHDPEQSSNKYLFMLDGIIAEYSPIPGDTIESVVSSFVNEINSKGYGHGVVASSVGNTLTIRSNVVIFPKVLNAIGDSVIFQTGLFTWLYLLGETRYYLIELNESYSGFQSVSTLLPEYEYSSLIEIAGIERYTRDKHQPFYQTTDYYNLEDLGESSAGSVPYIVPTSSSAVYDQPNSRIVFSNQSPLKPKEVATLVYR